MKVVKGLKNMFRSMNSYNQAKFLKVNYRINKTKEDVNWSFIITVFLFICVIWFGVVEIPTMRKNYHDDTYLMMERYEHWFSFQKHMFKCYEVQNDM